MKNRQIRVSESNYELVDLLSKSCGVSRSEILNNAISIVKAIYDKRAKSIKIICDTGQEKELLISIPLSQKE